MTKEYIMSLKNPDDIILALSEDMSLLDKEISDHLRDARRRELVEMFGTYDVLYTPPKKKQLKEK